MHICINVCIDDCINVCIDDCINTAPTFLHQTCLTDVNFFFCLMRQGRNSCQSHVFFSVSRDKGETPSQSHWRTGTNDLVFLRKMISHFSSIHRTSVLIWPGFLENSLTHITDMGVGTKETHLKLYKIHQNMTISNAKVTFLTGKNLKMLMHKQPDKRIFGFALE